MYTSGILPRRRDASRAAEGDYFLKRIATGNIIQTARASYEIYLTSKYATKPPTLDKIGKANTIVTMIQLVQ